MGAEDKSREETFIKHQVSQRMREGKRKKEGRISSPNSCLLCLLSYFKGFSCLLSFPYFTIQKKKMYRFSHSPQTVKMAAYT